MKLNLKHTSAAAALLALSSTAFADLTQTDVNSAQNAFPVITNTADTISGSAPPNSTTFSSLIFFAYNSDGSFSQVQTLGLRGGKDTNAGTFSNTLTNDPGTLLNFSLNNAAGLNSNASTLLWGIMSYDNNGTVSSAATVNLLTTIESSSILSGPGATQMNTSGIIGAGNAVGAFLQANPSTAADSVTGTRNALLEPNSDNWAANNAFTAGLTASISAAASASSTMAMYLFSNSANANTGAIATATAYAGTWALNALSGTLTYSVANTSAVPVPAAVWLLMSGLGGLGIVGRRRSAATA